MIPGLEKAVSGRDPGDEFTVTIRPEDAYGWPQRQLIRTVAKDMIQSDAEEIEVGMLFQLGSGAESQVVKVIEVEQDSVTIDGNHPLAGLDFCFRHLHPGGSRCRARRSQSRSKLASILEVRAIAHSPFPCLEPEPQV